jgi:hypothetical protein
MTTEDEIAQEFYEVEENEESSIPESLEDLRKFKHKKADRELAYIHDAADRNLPLNQAEIAAFLGLSKRTIQMLTKQGMPCFYVGALQHFGKGSRPRYRPDDCLRWLETRNERTA